MVVQLPGSQLISLMAQIADRERAKLEPNIARLDAQSANRGEIVRDLPKTPDF